MWKRSKKSAEPTIKTFSPTLKIEGRKPKKPKSKKKTRISFTASKMT